ncbi:hypothetical protein HF288_13175 [Acidithiobacillus caldus]|uniref:hypothetical protein n=1 Tax=Acidithiobacillus caldus TaxID=33059 RepID=UPI001C06D5B9|nr:hypothetical protein [Acidithiobacillus caldus]MBU2822254.1 hypothetical protein [Acidithiobacillus caldus]
MAALSRARSVYTLCMKAKALFRKWDAALIRYFERPAPRKMAEGLLWAATHLEILFFLPFRLFFVPMAWILDRHGRKMREIRDHLRDKGNYS